MRDGFELHDSYLLSIETRTGQVHLDATMHRFADDPERHETGMQKVCLVIPGLSAQEEQFSEGERDIYRDEVWLGDAAYNELFPVPFSFSGPVRFHFYFRDGSELYVSGNSLTIEPTGPFRFGRLYGRAVVTTSHLI